MLNTLCLLHIPTIVNNFNKFILSWLSVGVAQELASDAENLSYNFCY